MRSGCRYTTTEDFKCGLSRFPVKGKRDQTWWNRETRDVLGNIIWLNHKLPILIVRISPSADLDIHLAVILIGSEFIIGEQTEHGSWFHMRYILHGKEIGSVTETMRHHLRTYPLVSPPAYTKIEKSFGVNGDIGGIVIVRRAISLAQCVANIPLVSAELN